MAGNHVASLEEEKRKRKIRDVRWNIAGSSALGVSLFGAAAALIFGGVMMCMAAGPVGRISLALIGCIFLIAIPAALCIWQGVDAFMSADHLRKNELRE
ncbi:MAG: hypothetical protein HY939_02300, partial [Gammaproteobacteria bacterium]|nr:hypothetical protein [Gammaproteobacteria bacterium]